jgi:hypothetical protein
MSSKRKERGGGEEENVKVRLKSINEIIVDVCARR